MNPGRMLSNENRPLLLSAAMSLLAIAAVSVAVVFRAQDIERFERLASETHASLCAFKVDLETRADSTQAFVDELRRGDRPPITGISIADLERSLAGQRATLLALVTLHCKETP